MTNSEMIQARMERELAREGHLYQGHTIEIEDLSWKIDGQFYPDGWSNGGYTLREAFQIKTVCDEWE